MADAPTLAQLLEIPTQQQVQDQEVLPELKSRKVRVSDWIRGGVYRGMAFVVSLMRVDIRKAIAALVAAGFEDYVFGFAEVPGGLDVTSWAPFVAKQRYNIERVEATYTRRTITLTNSTATPYGPLEDGDVVVEFTDSGNRYVLDEEETNGAQLTIPASSSVEATFRSEFPTDSTNDLSYNDASDSDIVLVTSFAGVTATNPAPDYSDVTQTGTGVGTVTPGGTPSGDHSVAVRIDTSGQAAAITWSTSLDGAAWVPHVATATVTNLGGYGINITLANNGGNPAFAAGTVYSFETPGSDITEVGRNVETPQELGTRCYARWPSLAVETDANGLAIPISPTDSGYELLAKRASTQVKIAFVTEGTVNNEVLIYVAGQGVLLSSGTIAAIQAFIDSHDMITDLPVVSSPTTGAVTLGGLDIVCRQGGGATAKIELQRRFLIYFGGVDPDRPLTVNPLIDHEWLVHLITTTPGVIRFNDVDLEINGTADDLQLPITPSAYEIATYSGDVATDFNWSEE